MPLGNVITSVGIHCLFAIHALTRRAAGNRVISIEGQHPETEPNHLVIILLSARLLLSSIDNQWRQSLTSGPTKTCHRPCLPCLPFHPNVTVEVMLTALGIQVPILSVSQIQGALLLD